jgi:putative tricarboxylic transport membrane protein
MPDLEPVIRLLAQPSSLLLVCIGSTLGVTVGAIPGLTGAMLIALSLPLTFSMSGEQALVLLVSMYVGSVSGGLITATLLRIPGTPASIMTTLDGYPMAQRGQADRALGLGIGASFVGGMIAWVFLILLAAPMAQLSLKFGPFEFFSLVMVAMVLIATVGGRGAISGLFAGFLGILTAMPGASPATGITRWTFGVHELDDGFKLLPVLIGLFAVNQVIAELLRLQESMERVPASRGRLLLQLATWKQHIANLIRSSLIGTWVGILPGIGANIGSVMAYAAAKNASKTPEAFGSGSEEGIVAAESANNATVGGALIPLVAMGIPGSVIDAILLGALVIHGLQPGPLLMQQNPLAVHTIMGTLLLANVFTFLLMLVSTAWIARLTQVPRWLLLPVILVFCVVGSYALANRMFDVWVMLGFGIIGFAMERLRIPLAPFVIGFVLAPIAEEHLSSGLMQSDGSYLPLVTRPISAVFCVIAVGLLTWSLRRKPRAAGTDEIE